MCVIAGGILRCLCCGSGKVNTDSGKEGPCEVTEMLTDVGYSQSIDSSR